jgi:hypothetical protein
MCPLLNFCSFPTSHNNRGDLKTRPVFGGSSIEPFLFHNEQHRPSYFGVPHRYGYS